MSDNPYLSPARPHDGRGGCSGEGTGKAPFRCATVPEKLTFFDNQAAVLDHGPISFRTFSRG